METPVAKADNSGTRAKSVKKLLGRRRASETTSKSNKKIATPLNQMIESSSKSKASSHTPTTVAEAQAIGENARMNDDLMWALDGLESTNRSSRDDSLADLIVLLSSRRGGLVLQGDGIVDILLERLASNQQEENNQMTLAIACILLILTMRGRFSIFTRETTIKLIEQAMACKESVIFPDNMTKLSKSISGFLSDQQVNRFLPREVSLSPLCICLAFLSFCLHPREDYDTTGMKLLLGKSECFRLVVDVAVAESSALNDPNPTMNTVQSLWKLKSIFLILEHACFACPENVECLSKMRVSSGCPPFLSQTQLIQWLTCHIKSLISQKLPEGLKKDCFRGILAVIMNLTEGNEKAAKALAGSDGLESLCYCVKCIVVQQTVTGPSIDTISFWIDELSTLLGILINIVEANDAAIAQIKRINLIKYDDGDNREKLLDIVTLLFLLTSDEDRGKDSVSNGEVTLDSLRDGEGRAIGSIISAYSSILLGFLVDEDPSACSRALEILNFESLSPVIATIRKCLAFYKNVGALTARTEISLGQLIARLESQPL